MQVPENTVEALYSHYLNILKEHYGRGEASALLKRLMSHYLKTDKYRIPVLAARERVSESELLKIHFGVKDLLNNKPLEYILGEADFYEQRFLVNDQVLIPRPETEELVDLIWKTAALKPGDKAIDIGTGSGCIAITLQKLLRLDMDALDISSKALELARRNAQRLGADLHFFELDFLDEQQWNFQGHYDLIVANPPYIRRKEKTLMHPRVLDYEPHQALFVPDDQALLFYRKILNFALRYLGRKGRIYLEVNEYLADEAHALFAGSYPHVRTLRDLNGKKRFVAVNMPTGF